MSHEQVQELLPDLALGLLDAGESTAAHRHVEACAECRADLQVFLHAGEALALVPQEIELPAGALDRIRAGVHERVSAGERPVPSSIHADRAVPSAGGRGRVIVGPWRSIALGAAAAVLLLAVGLTGVTIAWLDARDDADRFEDQLAARALELPLSGEGASGAIYVASDFKSAVATFSGLEPAPAQHHYQVWSEGPFGARSAADFTGSDGELVVQLPELPRDMTRMFVTIEPDGAAGDRPTGPEVLTTPR